IGFVLMFLLSEEFNTEEFIPSLNINEDYDYEFLLLMENGEIIHNGDAPVFYFEEYDATTFVIQVLDEFTKEDLNKRFEASITYENGYHNMTNRYGEKINIEQIWQAFLNLKAFFEKARDEEDAVICIWYGCS
ncbi:MAG: DUF1877 family protein, partial [Pseudomonadales bacterium]|nr:DUF1877 family protein [Pseudomonadales bacterium]